MYSINNKFDAVTGRTDDSPIWKKVLVLRNLVVSAFGTVDNAVATMDLWSCKNKFDASLAYQHFRRHGARVPWHRQIWCPEALPKFSFIGWLAARGRLLTRDRLHGPVIHLECPFCGTRPESHAHLFFACPVTSSIWLHIKSWCGIRREMSTYASALKWLKKDFSSTSWHHKIKRLAFLSK